MKNLLKKILSFSLLLTGSLPVVFTLFFLCKQQLVRHAMKEKLERQMLHTIIVPEAEVQWVKYKKEIHLNDKMFDVESFIVKNGQYIFTGLFDDEETALNNYFEKNTEQKNERENHILSVLFQLLQSVYPGNSADILIGGDNCRTYCCLILSNISSPIKNILTPPPQA